MRHTIAYKPVYAAIALQPHRALIMEIRTSTITCTDNNGSEHTIEIIKAFETRRSYEGTFIYPHPWAYFWNGLRVHSPRPDVFQLPSIGQVIRNISLRSNSL